jgi:signal transduction histidine kinase
MSLSVRFRLLLAMNALVIAVGMAVGWAGIEVAGRAIERRLVDESAQNAAGIFRTMQLPLSDTMLSRLRQILGAEVAAGPFDQLEIDATSLPEPEAQALLSRIAQGPLPRRVTLVGKTYFVGTAPVAARQPGPPVRGRMCLYLLVPESQVEAAKQASERTLLGVTVAAIVAATLLAFWLSGTILRPIRRLAGRMDVLWERASQEGFSGDRDAASEQGPAEIARLAKSFDRLLARLEEARRKLARSARLATVGQLSAAIAHELRNPLSGIQMNARVLADEMAKAGLSDSSLDRIIREADRMNLYLEELLGLARGDSRPDAPHNLSDLPRVRLDAVADSVLALVDRRCRHAGVQVCRRWDPAAIQVRADETQIRQVVLNLVLNALDAMPSGGAVTLATSAGDAGAVRFSVADTGKGLCVSEGTDVFEPFVTTKPGGVGLGLYVCRRNVERHRGRIGYDSSRGGTTFWFELPAAD